MTESPETKPKFLFGGETLSGLSAADIEAGFQKAETPADVNMGPAFSTEFENGDTQEGNPFDKGGFLSRPAGWAR